MESLGIVPLKDEKPQDYDHNANTNDTGSNMSNKGEILEEQDLKLKQEKIRQQLRQQKLDEKKRKEEEEINLRKEQAIKSMQYLLSRSMRYSHFFQEKLKKYNLDSKIKKKAALREQKQTMEQLLDETVINTQTNRKQNETEMIDITKQIKYFEGGTLRPYQIEGLTWLTVLFENGVNGILADEMGLGKTIQVIALICLLMQRNIDGPYLIVAPLSTIPNWMSEFKRFAPKIPVILLHGNIDERTEICRKILRTKYKLEDRVFHPVVITTYQVPLMEKIFLKKFRWQYIIVDEAHRIKNHLSRLSMELRDLSAVNKLLLTGTPLQNNLTELWALLNFLLPHIFTDMDAFASLLMLEDMDNKKIIQEEKQANIVSTIHKVLAPFMLRRLKCDVLGDMVPKKEILVYCPLSKLQRKLYSYILQRNIAKLQGKISDIENEENSKLIDQPRKKRLCTLNKKYTENEEIDLTEEQENIKSFIKKEENIIGQNISKDSVEYINRLTMQNTMIMFKKVVDHPYLINFPLDPNSKEKALLVDEQLVQQSGKMLVLDAMLAKLKIRNHKVLIFSTLVMLLDLIEDYLLMRQYKYCRLDGSMRLNEREKCIKQFNTDPDTFVFLISTRAGGLGLNLTAADTVILYDRDWNPQVDLQAQDRCHRIGQTKPVVIYSLVSKNTIDERIIHCGNLKRRLEKIVILDGKFKSLKDDEKSKMEMDLQELQNLLNSSDCSEKIHCNGFVFSDEELDRLLDRSDLYKEMELKENKNSKK